MINSDLKRFLNPQYSFTLADINLLEQEVKDNPWFQTAYQFLAKAKHQMQDSDYNHWLNQAAIYAIDRENLFNYIYKLNTTTPHKVKVEKAPREDIPVKNTEIKTASEISIGPAKTATGEEVKSKDDLRKIVREQLAKIEKAKHQPSSEQEEESKKTNFQPPPKQTKENVKADPQPHTEEEDQKEKADQPPSKQEEESEKVKLQPRLDQKEEGDSTKDQKIILEEFIKTEPSVSRPKDGPYGETLRLAKESLEDHMDFVSETLAEIYFKQDYHKKAIKIYKQLMLKVPEKKLYFAARIKEIVDNK